MFYLSLAYIHCCFYTLLRLNIQEFESWFNNSKDQEIAPLKWDLFVAEVKQVVCLQNVS